ncbi:hypothetical protein [Nostoc sp. 'Lobaria pulmonaria (5183) cyanobiont']|uniref:hypothetical protein n=1 Tax=Nostoc sp. 'Lobaria pulmonaria (5183) cyanobiont' TaxID=1618022 RepID=UPI000CF320E9|nr:hypothetical protein [Nostoc sp. 'Lobaria pulmonaria (5183) cyanobiont']AVH72287.1 hypothetical protein NLP_3772 [Nostoc sp. 'Lobaria pulmonaria (5183) cyanobiont']
MPSDNIKIIDNPSYKKLLETFSGMKSVFQIVSFLEFIGIKNASLSEAFSNLPEVQEQLKILYIPDKFNEYFSKFGWVAYESLNVDLMQKAIELVDKSKFEEAENLLTDYYNEQTLQWLLMTMLGVKEFRNREEFAKLAKEDYLAERYYACVPILLMLIDGLVNDIEQTGFFAEGTDLTAWDSIAAHSSGLQELSKLFSVNRTTTISEKITIPYRNGILHGRDLGYANKIVAAKCWAALFVIKDWAIAISKGNKNPPPVEQKQTIIQAFQDYLDIQNLKRNLNNWKKRQLTIGIDVPSTGCPDDYEKYMPERTFAKFMLYWANSNYGKMATLITDYLDIPINKKAGQVRQEFGHIKPISFLIISINDTAPATTTIIATVKYIEKEEAKTCEITTALIYINETHKATLRGEPNGIWSIHQRSFNPIIYSNLV